MRVFYLLCVVAITLFATTPATTELSSRVSTDADPATHINHVVGTSTRFLRDVQDKTENEERGFVDQKKVDELLQIKQLDGALYNKPNRIALFKKWIAAPADVRRDAVWQLFANEKKFGKYEKIVRSWNAFKRRTDAGVGGPALYPTIEGLLNPTMLDKAVKGGRTQKALFKKWNKAPVDVRNAAIAKLATDEKLSVKYKKILDAWKHRSVSV
ncbi:Secreted RxLR effector peptide protein [Phytophthora palmivora]|uniref:RxLR effector protein n=1 Tax=Phytophthora palmivora TaxID=4796 RepID=A0A2P4XJ87_9STRA|nr:Secreted RxLR effector peptide protein [Phytophthora palmivora]